MRLSLVALLLLMLAGLAHAADPAKNDAPPPPPMPQSLPSDQTTPPEPEVIVVKKKDATITEYRIGGHVYMQKVQPAVGPAYYLLDEQGSGSFVRRDTDPIQPPMWTIKQF